MSTVNFPPIALIGAEGSGRSTVAAILAELAGYTVVEGGPSEVENGLPENNRLVTFGHERGCIVDLQGDDFRVVYVYASDGDRITRLRAAGRLLPGAECPRDDSPTDLADYGLMNDDSINHLRWRVAELLTRIQT